MPITENGTVEYSMPKEIKDLITFDFCRRMLHELHMIWGFSLEDFYYDSVGYCEGTAGWYEAFMATCRKLELDNLVTYYLSLPYYDSDLFDGELTQIIVDNKLLLPTTISDEIARQHNIKEEDVVICNDCNKYFNKNDVIVIREESEIYESVYKCKKCHSNEDISNLEVDIKKAIKEVLKLPEERFFLCDKCKKLHYDYNKGNKYCAYCEIQEISENKNANNYYREQIKLNEKYVMSLVPEKMEYMGYEANISYSKEDDLFYGSLINISDLVSFHSKTYDDIRKEFESAVNDYIEFKKEVGKK